MFRWKFRVVFLLVCGLLPVKSDVTRYEADGMSFSLLNPSTEMAGRSTKAEPYVVKGDMLFTEETWMIWNSAPRGIIQGDWYRWPKDTAGNVIVPYEVAADFPGLKSNLLLAQEQWSSKTCVKFIEKTDPILATLPAGVADNWIRYQNGGGCSSYVGMIHRGAQEVTLGSGCDKPAVAAHEIGHALGFGHENQRSDRDDWLVSFPENIQAGMSYNFDKENFDNYGVPYNYRSVMHYFWNAFSIDPSKLPTLMPKDPSLRYLLEDNYPVDHYDALAANLAYGCIDTWKAKCGAAAPTCLNYGYLGPSCTCVCPEGTSGADCGTKTAASLPAYPPPACGGKITTAGSYSVPGMGGARSAGLKCTWYVEAPACTTATVTITNFYTYDTTCTYEKLQVGALNVYVPEVGPLCGGKDKVPDGTQYVGSPSVALYFKSNVGYGSGAGGFNFKVDFVPQTGCSPTTTVAPGTTTNPLTTTAAPPTTTPTTTTPPPTTTTTTRPPTTTTTTQPPTTTTATRPPTTTTTTRPPTTTPVPTTKPTTAAPLPLGCLLTKINATTFSWTSPGFPGKAPANSRCSVFGTTTTNGFRINLKSFAVTSDTACSKAYVVIAPTFPLKWFCNNKSGTSLSIAKKFVFMQYQSDPLVATTGFNITISAI